MEYRKIVIKIGTNLLTDKNDSLAIGVISSLVSQIAILHKEGLDVVVVSSGAIAAGRGVLNIKQDTSTALENYQAQAAVGQHHLMETYGRLFFEENITVGQALLTRGELSSGQTGSNVRRAIDELFKLKVIPIVNENDVVATDEIEASFGDNDKLSAAVANLIAADLLIFLTDQDGLFDDDPRVNSRAKMIKHVPRITDEIILAANNTPSRRGKGGMASKILAAAEATSWGTTTVIANGLNENVVTDIVSGQQKGTFFEPWGKKVSSSKRRSLGKVFVKGSIVVDKGATEVLLGGKSSLLAVGVVSVEGFFQSGDIVEIMNPNNDVIARGASSYPSEVIKLLKGLKSESVREVVSKTDFQGDFIGGEIVHIDNMVLV